MTCVSEDLLTVLCFLYTWLWISYNVKILKLTLKQPILGLNWQPSPSGDGTDSHRHLAALKLLVFLFTQSPSPWQVTAC